MVKRQILPLCTKLTLTSHILKVHGEGLYAFKLCSSNLVMVPVKNSKVSFNQQQSYKLLQLSLKIMYAILFRRKESGPPTADSLVQMLIQALHSQDNNLLEVSMIIHCKNVLISFIKGPYCNKCTSPTNHPSYLAKLAHKHPSSSLLSLTVNQTPEENSLFFLTSLIV